jgi:Ca2+-binding EF-hand superfamily protein
MKSMVWAFILLAAISYVTGLCFLQACISYFRSEESEVDPETREAISVYWGSISKAVLSLYLSVLGGEDWNAIATPLKKTGNIFYWLFLLYVGFFNFCIMNIVSSLFFQAMLSSVASDQQEIIREEMERKHEYASRLQQFFHALDDDSSGHITYEEFCSRASDPFIEAWANSLEIEVADITEFFAVLSDHGRLNVDVTRFVEGCIKLKGNARNVDLMDLISGFKRFMSESLNRHDMSQQMFAEIHEAVKESHRTILILHRLDVELQSIKLQIGSNMAV